MALRSDMKVYAKIVLTAVSISLESSDTDESSTTLYCLYNGMSAITKISLNYAAPLFCYFFLAMYFVLNRYVGIQTIRGRKVDTINAFWDLTLICIGIVVTNSLRIHILSTIAYIHTM